MEIWKDIKGFEGIYQISNYGRVKSLARKCGTCQKREKIRKVHKSHDGYLTIRLQAGEKDVTTRVHRLVALAFIPLVDGKDTVNHIDGNKLNNHVSNLEWADRHEQLQHAYDLGLKKAKKGSTCLTDEEIDEIRSIYIKGSREYGSTKLASKYDVSHRTILNVIHGKFSINE